MCPDKSPTFIPGISHLKGEITKKHDLHVQAVVKTAWGTGDVKPCEQVGGYESSALGLSRVVT